MERSVADTVVKRPPTTEAPIPIAQEPGASPKIGTEEETGTIAVERLSDEISRASASISERLQEISSAIGRGNEDVVLFGLPAELWVTMAAVGTLFVAIIQLSFQARKLALETKISTMQSRTQFFFDISRQWESEALIKSRALLAEIASREQEAVMREHPQSTVQQRHHIYIQRFGRKLSELRETDTDRYIEALKVFNFLEQLAYAARKNYIPLDDVNHMFGGIISDIAPLFLDYVKSLRSQMARPELYENVEWLLGRIQPQD